MPALGNIPAVTNLTEGWQTVKRWNYFHAPSNTSARIVAETAYIGSTPTPLQLAALFWLDPVQFNVSDLSYRLSVLQTQNSVAVSATNTVRLITPTGYTSTPDSPGTFTISSISSSTTLLTMATVPVPSAMGVRHDYSSTGTITGGTAQPVTLSLQSSVAYANFSATLFVVALQVSG